MDARVRRRQHKELFPIQFAPVDWQPQVEVTFTRDVTGWLDRDQRVKWHFSKGQQVMVDEQHAVEFITKGYATGELPRGVSDDERAELLAQVTVIGMGQAAPQTRNGSANG